MERSGVCNELNNHLLAQLDRLSDKSLKGDELRDEIERARAVAGVSAQVIANANVALKAFKMKDEALDAKARLPKMFINGGES